MSYSKRGNVVSMRCNTDGCRNRETHTLGPDETSLDGYRALWADNPGWTSSSTDHHCPQHSR
jgi:hypothetical protein